MNFRHFFHSIRKASGHGTTGEAWSTDDAHVARVQFEVELMEDELDGGYVASCTNLPGCMSQGETVEEALEGISEAISGVMESRFHRALNEPGPQSEIKTIRPGVPSTMTIPLEMPQGSAPATKGRRVHA